MDSVANNHIGNFDNLSQFMHYPRMSIITMHKTWTGMPPSNTQQSFPQLHFKINNLYKINSECRISSDLGKSECFHDILHQL